MSRLENIYGKTDESRSFGDRLVELAHRIADDYYRDVMPDLQDRIESGEIQLRWRYVKEPEYLLSEIADLDAERREFPLADEVNVRLENFITQDEIDSRLTHGSGVSQGLFRIYDYFNVPWRPSEEGHTQRYIRQKPRKINKYRAIQQPTMTCRYRVGGSFFTLTFSG